jgi:tocopherol O-methyltransferase
MAADPLTEPPREQAELVREHYDRLSPLYNTLWGEHIHHGYFEDGESPRRAQLKLTERLARRARMPASAHVLDVGCGLGGSSLWLARELGCRVRGITLSPVQARAATERARRAGLSHLTSFEVADAEKDELGANVFDAVWVIECSEHLSDKAAFIARAARALKPGGRLALCAWLKGEEVSNDEEQAQLVREVCEAMLCPSLGTRGEYEGWMRAAGLVAVEFDDLTRRVAPTWEHCAALAGRAEVRAAIRLFGERTRRFVASFELMRRAYTTGAMRYGMFVATREGT